MDLSFLDGLNVKITPHALLKDFTTFRLGGPCLAMIESSKALALTETVRRLRQKNIPFIMMGFGSNTLASDKGVDTVIVRYSSSTPQVKRQDNRIHADVSTLFDDLILFAIKENLEGLTSFSGIPGTIGGAIAGNAGAYGFEISQSIVELTLLKPDNTVITIPKDAIHFSYRDSDLKHNGDIILSAVFELKPGKGAKDMLRSHDNIIANRHTKHGDWRKHPSAGSFFRNVEPTSKADRRQAAGFFLEEAGAKALNINGAHCYAEHANIITRDDGATAQSVYELTLKMAEMVKAKFGIELVREVRLLGKFENAPACDVTKYW
jgi:UDP-N-acetylmuramate dehydrogenase